jgi:hypothetical protein
VTLIQLSAGADDIEKHLEREDIGVAPSDLTRGGRSPSVPAPPAQSATG